MAEPFTVDTTFSDSRRFVCALEISSSSDELIYVLSYEYSSLEDIVLHLCVSEESSGAALHTLVGVGLVTHIRTNKRYEWKHVAGVC